MSEHPEADGRSSADPRRGLTGARGFNPADFAMRSYEVSITSRATTDEANAAFDRFHRFQWRMGRGHEPATDAERADYEEEREAHARACVGLAKWDAENPGEWDRRQAANDRTAQTYVDECQANGIPFVGALPTIAQMRRELAIFAPAARRSATVTQTRAPRRTQTSSGRPRAQATRSSAKSGDSGEDDPPGEPARLALLLSGAPR